MRVLLISSLYPEPCEFGIKPDTKAVHYFAREWISNGHQVVVIHPLWNPISKIKRYFQFFRQRVCEYSIDIVPVIFGISQILVPHRLAPTSFQQRIMARKILERIKVSFPKFTPDCIITHFPTIGRDFCEEIMDAYPSSHKVCTLHGIDIRTIKSDSKIRKDLDYYKQFFYRSYSLARRGFNLHLPYDKNAVVLSGIDASLIMTEEQFLKKMKQSDCRETTFVFAGNLIAQKRVNILIHALSILPSDLNWSLTIIGDGSDRSLLEKLVRHLNLTDRIHFVGQQPREIVSDYMRKANAFVMVSKDETLGLVYLEAMGQACIPIGSRDEGIDGIIIDNENGFLCTPGNVVELSKTIEKLCRLGIEERKKLARKAYSCIKGMTSESMASKYINMIKF